MELFQTYRGGQFYWWRKPEKTTVTDKLYHNVISSTDYGVHFDCARFELTMLVVIDTECIYIKLRSGN
jgi:hypothetical protein